MTKERIPKFKIGDRVVYMNDSRYSNIKGEVVSVIHTKTSIFYEILRTDSIIERISEFHITLDKIVV